MVFGMGPSLGLLAVVGYAVSAAGAAVLWRCREDLNLWAQDEYGALRRGVARHAAFAGAVGLREENRFKFLPACFVPALEESRRERITRGALFFLLGPMLFVLDFFL